MKTLFTILIIVIPLIIGYLIGSVPTGLIIAKAHGVDLTVVGSKNTGGTNVGRVLGKKLGILTMILDIFKCYIPCLLTLLVLTLFKLDIYSFPQFRELLISLVAIFVCLGHAFPIFNHFKGGKIMACLAGYVLFLSPIIFSIGLLTFLVTFFITKRVSIGSITCSVTCFFLAFIPMILDFTILQNPNSFNLGVYFSSNVMVHLTYIFPIVMLILVGFLIFRHRANIERIKNGTEPETHFKTKQEIESEKEGK